MNKFVFLSIVVLAGVAFFFSGVGFGFSFVEQTLVGALTFTLFFLAARRNLHQFFVTVLAAFSTAASLGCAFLNKAEATGPFVVDITIHPWLIVAISAIVACCAWQWQARGKSENRFAAIMVSLFVFNWIILAFNVRFYDDWKMENWLTVPFVIILYVIHRWFRLSNASYGLLFLFMMLHIYGSHYTYSEVPFGFWMEEVLGVARNHYDRIVHFSFGFLLAYPIRELIVRVSNTKGFWSYWFPVEFVLAFACIYEIIEWTIAIIFGGDLGVAYLGTQGDVWDAQKDMFLAGIGSIIAMLVIAIIVWYYKRNDFWHEIWESLTVKHKKALGEVALENLKK